MTVADIQKTIAEAKDNIRRDYKAEVKAIFGSYARGDNHADSDLDLLVDFYQGASLFEVVRLERFLEDKFGCKVDVVSRRALRKELRDAVFKEMIAL